MSMVGKGKCVRIFYHTPDRNFFTKDETLRCKLHKTRHYSVISRVILQSKIFINSMFMDFLWRKRVGK